MLQLLEAGAGYEGVMVEASEYESSIWHLTDAGRWLVQRKR
jgi:hypothetical protein